MPDDTPVNPQQSRDDISGLPRKMAPLVGKDYPEEKPVYEKIGPLNDGHVHGTGAAAGHGYDHTGGSPLSRKG